MGSFQDYMVMANQAQLQAAAVTPTSQVKSEAKLYLSEMPAPPLETDVLEWWASNEMKFSALSVMVLSIRMVGTWRGIGRRLRDAPLH